MFEFNPWWETGEVPKDFLPKKERLLFHQLKSSLKKRYIDVITGLRRTGKTTLMYQLISFLLRSGIKPRNILYFTFDERKKELKDIVREYEEKVLKERVREKKVFIFLDEIHKLDGWADKLKILYDFNPKAKIIVSGSASLNLMRSARESLAGRCIFHRLNPLSFREFLILKGEKIPKYEEIEIYEGKMRILLSKFMERGFPEILNSNEKEAKRYIKELIVERIIYRDIPESFKIKDIEIVKLLANYIFSNPGTIINIESLSKDLQRSKKTIRNTLEYLELSFLIKRLSNLRGSFLAASRKNKKAYPIHTSLCQTKNEPKIIECLIRSETDAEYYWRLRNKEVDFILKNEQITPIEVKYKEKISKKDLKSITSFNKKFHIKKGIVITKEDTGKIENIELIPLHTFLLYKDKFLH